MVNSAARRKAWKASDRAAQIAILPWGRWSVDCWIACEGLLAGWLRVVVSLCLQFLGGILYLCRGRPRGVYLPEGHCAPAAGADV